MTATRTCSTSSSRPACRKWITSTAPPIRIVTTVGNLNGTGNSLDNVITGNDGNNILTGGAGVDNFVFKPNFGLDIIADFHPGEDIVEFSHTTFSTSSDILSHAANDGQGNVIIFVDINNIVTLENMTVALMQQHLSDFHIS
jgi:hypothetical protein